MVTVSFVLQVREAAVCNLILRIIKNPWHFYYCDFPIKLYKNKSEYEEISTQILHGGKRIAAAAVILLL